MPTLANIFDAFLGLRELSLSDAGLTLEYARPLPAWGWLLVVIAAFLFAGWSYGRLLGSRQVRICLACLRAGVLVLMAILLSGPQVVRTDERVEPDHVLMLVDRSASLGIADMTDAAGHPRTRDAALRDAVAAVPDAFVESEKRRFAWYGFGGEPRPIGATPSAWPRADAPATPLRTAIDRVLDETAGKPVSAIVLLTDGRSPQATGSDLVQRLQQRAVPVFVVPLGAEKAPLDYAVAQAEAPDRAFVRDIVPVTVRVDRVGGEDDDAQHARVVLRDPATGGVLDEQPLADTEPGEPVRLAGRGEAVGRVTWEVAVIYDPPAGRSAERVTTNNAATVTVELIDRPIRVLYVDGYPRWEYRYLKGMLVREDSIDSSILLLSADRHFGQEGDTPIARLPADPEEMLPFDVIVIGDVPANYFTADQMALMRDQVGVHGAGLLWMGGPRSTPGSYAGSILEALLPMREPAAAQPANATSIAMQPAPAARALSVLQLRGPSSDNDWPTDLPSLRWAQELGALKSAAEPLATAESTGSDGALPLVLRMRYGAGQSLYVATDETWRFRYGRGELYFEQFWLQLVRMLGRQRVQQADDLAVLTLSHRQVNVDDAVVVEVELRAAAAAESRPARIEVTVADLAQADGAAVDRLELLPAPRNESASRPVYRATWRPGTSGALEVRVTEPALASMGLARRLDVIAADDELRRVLPDHARLETLARQTGGQVVALDELDTIAALAPARTRIIPDDVRESLWDSTAALAVVVLLLAMEWVLRRLIRLA